MKKSTKKASFTSKLTRLFFEEQPAIDTPDVGEETAGSEEQRKNQRKNPIDMRPILVPAHQETIMVAGEYNEEYFNNLLSVISENDLEGNDYFEFRRTLVGMSGLGLGEDKLFNAAFTSLQVQDGMDKQRLVDSIRHYFEILEQEKHSFSESIEQTKASTVNVIALSIEEAKNNLSHLQEELIALTESIRLQEESIVQKEQQLIEATTKIEKAEKDFEVTLLALKKQIRADEEKIQSHIPGDVILVEKKKSEKKK